MRTTTDQLSAQLAKKLAPLYAVHGAEPLLAFEAADRIRADARKAGYTEREVLTVEPGFDWSTLNMSANSLSLFASKRILELRIPTGKPGVEGSEAIARFCERLPDDTICLVSLPGLERVQMDSKWFTALDAVGVTVEAKPVDRRQLPDWLGRRLAVQKQQCDADTLQWLTERVEGNLLAAYQEVQKLALLFPEGTLNGDAVREAVLDVSRYDVWKLGEAVLQRDVPRLTRMLEGLQGEGAAPPLVLWAITAEIRALLKVSEGLQSGRPMAQLLRDARVWGVRQQWVEQAAKRADPALLKQALARAAEVDQLIKGLRRGDVWDQLLQLALLTAGKPAIRQMVA
jgi:DNA polymerase III subunit delta